MFFLGLLPSREENHLKELSDVSYFHLTPQLFSNLFFLFFLLSLGNSLEIRNTQIIQHLAVLHLGQEEVTIYSIPVVSTCKEYLNDTVKKNYML